jgi:hypothetical protein
MDGWMDATGSTRAKEPFVRAEDEEMRENVCVVNVASRGGCAASTSTGGRGEDARARCGDDRAHPSTRPRGRARARASWTEERGHERRAWKR